MHENRTLVQGENLNEMRKFPDESIDLIAIDPPFNPKRDYFVPFRDGHGQEPDTLVKAFTNTWTWKPTSTDLRDTRLFQGRFTQTSLRRKRCVVNPTIYQRNPQRRNIFC